MVADCLNLAKAELFVMFAAIVGPQQSHEKGSDMTLTDRDSHFEFGANWRDYAKGIDKNKIEGAIEGMRRLFPDGLTGKTFLDIGCGSGLHSLAALLLGAASVSAVDIDENSVATTQETLSRFADRGAWKVRQSSVFDLTPADAADVVYSWGVLHHTGDMWRAIDIACSLVNPAGQLSLAIYAKTPMDAPWKVEKRIYKSLPPFAQAILRTGFIGVIMAARTARGKNPLSVLKEPLQRGMSITNDVHDWLGGFPYDTATVEELTAFVSERGLKEARSFPMRVSLGGLLGSGCHEIVFRLEP
jgi:2-polyprenyl-6-hydroxyphenyl methylase/3-demethylubiquinone-9 3-methyltransferase